MSRELRSKRCPVKAEKSPGIIENKSATLPEEIWEKIFYYTEYRDVLNLKIVSKHFNAMATRVVNMKYKWYLLCQKEVPESQWCEILKHAQHPVNDNINCVNFHSESEYPAIWEFLYSTWTEFSRFTDEELDSEKFRTDYIRGCLVIVRFDGNIIAFYTGGVIRFYDIHKLGNKPICEICLPGGCNDFLLSNKGTDLTLVRKSYGENEWTMENWEVPSQELMNSQKIGPAQWLCIRESFGYLCLIRTYTPHDDTYCEVEIREVAARGTPRSVRIRIEEGHQDITRVEVHGDTLWLLTWLVSTVKVYKISIRETLLKETCEIPRPTMIVDGKLRILHPSVAVSTKRYKLRFSVSGREWTTYDWKKDLKLGSALRDLRSMTYEGGILALLSDNGRDLKMIKVGDPDRFDSELGAMPSRTIRVDWDYYDRVWGVQAMGFTEYNSIVYFVIATKGEWVVMKSR